MLAAIRRAVAASSPESRWASAQALAAAQFLNVPFFLGDELQEGAQAFLERRRPSWAEEDRS